VEVPFGAAFLLAAHQEADQALVLDLAEDWLHHLDLAPVCWTR
jgi:hypothetical protein